MSDVTTGRENAGTAARSASDIYRAVWRWHFYAGLLVLPFMIILAVTGALYLYKDEIDTLIHADLKRVAVQTGAVKLAPSALVEAALKAYPGTAVKVTDPISPDTSAEITVATAAQGKRAVYVDPYNGQVLGSLPDRGTIMWTVRYLHSMKYFGPFARALIEIAGGWSILLVGTGLYLWWPRKQAGGIVTLRGTPKRRVTGLFVGAVIVFLAVTGMPWSGVWGAKVNEWANGNNFGYPAGVRVAVPMSAEHLDHMAKTSWSLEQARVPPPGGVPGRATPSLGQAGVSGPPGHPRRRWDPISADGPFADRDAGHRLALLPSRSKREAPTRRRLDHVAFGRNRPNAKNVIDSKILEHCAKNRFPLFRAML